MPNRLLYQRTENASGSRDSISGVKFRNGVAVNDSGMTATSGATRKNSTKMQNAM